MKKYLYVVLMVFCVACTSSNNSEKEYLSVDELNAYKHLMDSISNIGESYTEPVFMGIKMGQPEKTVVDALFTLEREKKISYDGKKFYFVHNFKGVDYRIEIDYDCGTHDALHALTFKGVNPLAAPFEIKMALNDYFKDELLGAKRSADEDSYKDAVKYEKSLLRYLRGKRFSFLDIKLFNSYLNTPNESGIEELVFDFEGK